jgi:hypothetical protein
MIYISERFGFRGSLGKPAEWYHDSVQGQYSFVFRSQQS